MLIGEVEVGKDYRKGQVRVRAVGIERLRDGYSRRYVRNVQYIQVDKETGLPLPGELTEEEEEVKDA